MAKDSGAHELENLRTCTESTKSFKNKPTEVDHDHKYRLTLEPALIGAAMAITLAQTSLQEFYLRTACTVDLGYDGHACDIRVGEQSISIEAESQKVVASINISRSFVGSLISTIVLLFIGPWSDCSGRRKPLLLLPLLGMSVMTTSCLLLLTFPGANTVQVLYAIQIPMSLGGNFGLLMAAAFSYLGDICHATGRDVTRTMGTHRAAIQIANVVGNVSGPLLYQRLGFYGVFPIVLFLQLSALVYVIFVVKDVKVNNENTVSVFNWRLPLNAVQCLVKPREGHRRKIILLIMLVTLGDRMLFASEVLLAYMYYRRKFGWADVMFGAFLAYKNVMGFIGTLLILTVMKRFMKLSDEVVGVVSGFSYMAYTGGLIAAQTSLVVFLMPIIGIIAQGSLVVQRPIMNKQISPTEQGKIYSVMGALESSTQIICSPLYSFLYSRTVESFPDAWLLPGLCMAPLQILSYLVARLCRRKTTYEERAHVNKAVKTEKKESSQYVKKDETVLLEKGNLSLK